VISGGKRFSSHVHFERIADVVVNAQCIVDPARSREFSQSTGLDHSCAQSVLAHHLADGLLNRLVTALQNGLVVYVYCRSGRHRSVALAEAAASAVGCQAAHMTIVMAAKSFLTLAQLTAIKVKCEQAATMLGGAYIDQSWNGSMTAPPKMVAASPSSDGDGCPCSSLRDFILWNCSPPGSGTNSAPIVSSIPQPLDGMSKRARQRANRRQTILLSSRTETRESLICGTRFQRVELQQDRFAANSWRAICDADDGFRRVFTADVPTRLSLVCVAGNENEQLLHVCNFLRVDDTTIDDFLHLKEDIDWVCDRLFTRVGPWPGALPVNKLHLNTAAGWIYKQTDEAWQRKGDCVSAILDCAQQKLKLLAEGVVPAVGVQSSGGRAKRLTRAKLATKAKDEAVGRFIRVCSAEDVLISEYLYVMLYDAIKDVNPTAIKFSFFGGLEQHLINLGLWDTVTHDWRVGTFFCGPDGIKYDSAFRRGLTMLLFRSATSQVARGMTPVGCDAELILDFILATHISAPCRLPDDRLLNISSGLSSGAVLVQLLESICASATGRRFLSRMRALFIKRTHPLISAGPLNFISSCTSYGDATSSLGDDLGVVLTLNTSQDLTSEGYGALEVLCREEMAAAYGETAHSMHTSKGQFGPGPQSYYFLARHLLSLRLSGREIDDTIGALFVPEHPTVNLCHLLLRLNGLLADNPLSPLTVPIIIQMELLEQVLSSEGTLIDGGLSSKAATMGANAKSQYVFSLLEDLGYSPEALLRRTCGVSRDERLAFFLKLYLGKGGDSGGMSSYDETRLIEGWLGLKRDSEQLTPAQVEYGIARLADMLLEYGLTQLACCVCTQRLERCLTPDEAHVWVAGVLSEEDSSPSTTNGFDAHCAGFLSGSVIPHTEGCRTLGRATNAVSNDVSAGPPTSRSAGDGLDALDGNAGLSGWLQSFFFATRSG
jgi:hypothetical protein